MSEENGVTLTLKGGQGYEAPWLVVRGQNATDVLGQLAEENFESLVKVGAATAADLVQTWDAEKKARGGQAAAAPAPARQAGPTPPAPSNPAPQAQAAGPLGPQTESDKWNNTYEHNHPQAPQTQHGPKVLKRGVSKAGKPYAAFIDPRSKAIPSVYASGVRQDPADVLPPDFDAARGL